MAVAGIVVGCFLLAGLVGFTTYEIIKLVIDLKNRKNKKDNSNEK